MPTDRRHLTGLQPRPSTSGLLPPLDRTLERKLPRLGCCASFGVSRSFFAAVANSSVAASSASERALVAPVEAVSSSYLSVDP